MKTFIILTAILSLAVGTIKAQEPNLLGFLERRETMEQYLVKLNLKDSVDDSRILLRMGKLHVTVSQETFAHVQHYKFTNHLLLQVNNTADIDKLTRIALPYSSNVGISALKARVYNIEDGKLQMTEYSKHDMTSEQLAGNVKLAKFNFPNVKKGSIVYYTFTYNYTAATSAFGGGNGGYHPVHWEFQDDYFTYDNYFDVTLDKALTYDQYNLNVSFTTTNTLQEAIDAANGVWTEESRRKRRFVYHRKNIPAFKEEPQTIEDEKYKEQITFRLQHLYSIGKRLAMIPSDWNVVNTDQLYHNRWLGDLVFHPDDTLAPLIKNIRATSGTDDLDFIRNTFRFVRDSIKNLGFVPQAKYMATMQPKAVWLTREGTRNDKNILLCALYRLAGLKSYPVVLSTQRRVKLSENYVDEQLLDYTLACVDYNGQLIVLDASSAYLPFGVLPPKCYNDFAWLVDSVGKAVTLPANALQDKNLTTATVKPGTAKNSYQIKLDYRPGTVTAMLARSEWLTDPAAFRQSFDQKINRLNHNMSILSREFINFTNPDSTMSISYTLKLNMEDNGNYLYFNPFVQPLLEANPFPNAERKYPVEYISTSNDRYILRFSLPEGYEPEESDPNTSLMFKSGAARYDRSMVYDPAKRAISLTGSFVRNTTLIPANEYKELRTFYENMISDQQKSIVLKKIKP